VVIAVPVIVLIGPIAGDAGGLSELPVITIAGGATPGHV